MSSTALFSKTPPLKLFFLASIPGAISMLASALYQTIDGVFVGRFLGETAFAAVNLAMPFVIINFSLADLIGVGSAVPISICLGKGQKQEADNIFTCACLLIVGTGMLIGGIMFAAAPLLIRLMGAEGAFANLAIQYLRVYALCSPVTTIIFAVDNYLRICGLIRGSMLMNILMSALSAGLEFLFLGVFGDMLRYDDLRLIGFYSLSSAENAASLLQAALQLRNDPADRCLRKPKLFKQYCRPDHLYYNECNSGTYRRRSRCLRVRYFNVCRRIRSAAPVRNVRFPSACGRV